MTTSDIGNLLCFHSEYFRLLRTSKGVKKNGVRLGLTRV